MITLSKLCEDVEAIGKKYGLEWEIIDPPKPAYYFKYQVRFRNSRLAPPINYVYEIYPHQWKRFQQDEGEYDEFILYLIKRINSFS